MAITSRSGVTETRNRQETTGCESEQTICFGPVKRWILINSFIGVKHLRFIALFYSLRHKFQPGNNRGVNLPINSKGFGSIAQSDIVWQRDDKKLCFLYGELLL